MRAEYTWHFMLGRIHKKSNPGGFFWCILHFVIWMFDHAICARTAHSKKTQKQTQSEVRFGLGNTKQ